MAKDIMKPSVLNCEVIMENAIPGDKYEKTEKLLKQSKRVCFLKTYGTVLTFYSWLKKKTQKRYPEKDYHSSRIFKEKFRDLSSGIFVKVIDGKIDLKGAPENPWLKEFYPEQSCYYISFPDLLGLNGSWQWFSKGISFPGLPHKIHPFYGTYFPTRFEHLELFDEWLKGNNTQFYKSIDVGTGCGVLLFYMLKHGMNNIYATDVNPNALISVKKDLSFNNFTEKIMLSEGDLFSQIDDKFSLVVFNPPWIPGNPGNIIDRGIFYENDLWNKFLSEAEKRMVSGGRILLFFSNFAQIAGISDMHPIKMMLENNPKFQLRNIFKKNRNPSNSKKKKHWMSVISNQEIVELWDIVYLGEIF